MILLVIDIHHHHTTLQKMGIERSFINGLLNSATTVWLSHLRLYHPILWIVWIFVQHLLIEMEAVVMICERPNSLFLSYPNSFLSPDTHSFFLWILACLPFPLLDSSYPRPIPLFNWRNQAAGLLETTTMVTINKIVRVHC